MMTPAYQFPDEKNKKPVKLKGELLIKTPPVVEKRNNFEIEHDKMTSAITSWSDN